MDPVAPIDPVAAIIIPHLNDAVRLRRCLGALVEGLDPKVRPQVDIVVVDNGSDPPVDWVRTSFPGVRLMTEPQKGAAHARNRGMAETSAPMVWFLDADCVPAPGWAAQALRHDDPDQIVVGPVTMFDETGGTRTGAQAFEHIFAFDTKAYAKKGFGVTANLITSRTLFDRAGPFRDGVPEDKEWCQRARAAGGQIIYDPQLVMQHPTRADWPALRAKWRRLVTEEWGVHQAAQKSLWRWRLRAVLVALSGPAHVPKVALARGLGPAEKARAAATLLKLRFYRSAWMLNHALNLPQNPFYVNKATNNQPPNPPQTDRA
ncbi:glycosyltransferase family 2 protein [Pseudooceanicola sp. MF1-13]|uniref:glycosyltransferase family 2 protein n=1 Tax=Pseudooceanicola sp. MF1-13 TaxID=3379095 RepID=UPI003892B77A